MNIIVDKWYLYLCVGCKTESVSIDIRAAIRSRDKHTFVAAGTLATPPVCNPRRRRTLIIILYYNGSLVDRVFLLSTTYIVTSMLICEGR